MVIMLLGNVFLGMGVSIFKLSEMGTDPFSGMVMALAEVLGIGYPVFLILVNLVLLFVEVKFGREMIGAGTVVNACLLGYIVTSFYTIWVRMFGGVPQNFAVRLALVCIAIIVMSFVQRKATMHFSRLLRRLRRFKTSWNCGSREAARANAPSSASVIKRRYFPRYAPHVETEPLFK